MHVRNGVIVCLKRFLQFLQVVVEIIMVKIRLVSGET